MCQQRSLGECRSGRWGYYSQLTSGGWWVGLGSKAAHRPKGRNTLKAVADEAGRGYTSGTSRGAGATYALNRAPAQPAPRSTCTASPYTRRPASRAQRDGVGAGCGRAAGQVSWGRVRSVGRFDRLWHTDGRPFVRGAHQRHGAAWQVASRPCRFEYAKGMQL